MSKLYNLKQKSLKKSHFTISYNTNQLESSHYDFKHKNCSKYLMLLSFVNWKLCKYTSCKHSSFL